ncbi:MAG: trigger factor [Candidatus Aureabacteria bacterium]|nr:trigger factor [Candidatus Auribacterota bacterium]
MDMKVETIDACRKRIRIEVPTERVDREIEAVFNRLLRTAQVSGFRPGKAPRKVLELHYGDQVKEEVKENLVEESFSEALKDMRFEPAVLPRVDTKALTLAGGTPFRYDVEVEVWPEFRLGGYSGIRAVRKKAVVGDEDVERYLQTLRDQHAEFIPVEDRPLAMGDFSLLDISGMVGDKPFDERKGVWLEMGQESYVPGFCEKLLGMKPEEERIFTLTLPQDVGEDIRGKEAAFRVTIHEIKLKKLPELTDEFCKEIGSYKSVDELRAAVKADLLAYAENQEERSVITQINNYLLENNEVPLPQTRVGMEAATLARKTAERLLTQGVDREEILKKKEELVATSRKEAEKILKLSCIYSEIAKRERIIVSPEEREERVRRIAERIKRDPGQVRVAMEKEGTLGALDEEIKSEKVEALLLKSAKVKEK